MDSILIILKKKWPKGFICPYTGTIYYNICIYSRSQVSVYRTIGPLVSLPLTKVGIHFGHVRMCATPCPISLIIFILDLGPSYTDKLLEFRWVQIAHLS